MSVPTAKSERPELKRVLRLWDSVAVIVGIIIGSGIFFTPTTVAREAEFVGTALLLWTLGGLAALLGSLTYAELASTWPRTGGIFVYLRQCFGPLPSFLFGWVSLTIIRPSAVAGISVIFANYVAYFIPLPQAGVKLVAIGAILTVSIINYLGVRRTSILQNILTSFKALALLIIAGGGLFFYQSSQASLEINFPTTISLSYFSAFAAALIGVFWTYDGWVEITNIAGEIRNPEKTIPKALFIATLGITALYVLVNAAYFNVLGFHGVLNSDRVASDAMVRVFGSFGGTFFALVVILSTFGALNGTTLTGPRIFFAMAVDGLFFEWGRRVDPKYRTPSTAIALQALLSVPLVVTWTFDQVATYFVFMVLIFYSLGTAAVFRLRRMKDAPKAAYRTWGYPWTPIAFITLALAILLNTTIRAPQQAGLGLLILAAGVPVYYIWQKSKNRKRTVL